ncbi:MAG: branched-chain amino acid ABC transporter substrate-binding protein [Acidobacteria bacterium]|nr:branched-chain amino acid ABC transporter substrate-binding protein [Acidobacteriota bacterium]
MTGNPIRVSRLVVLAVFALAAAAVLFAACGGRPPVLVGAIISETGNTAEYGKQIKRGMDLAVEEIAASGGIMGGRKLEMVFADDGSDPKKALEIAKEMVEKKQARALIGGVSSAVALGLTSYVNGKGIVLLSPSASSPELTYAGGDFFFRVYPSDLVEGQAMADMARKLGFQKAAIIAAKGAFGQGIADVFQGHFESPNDKVVLREDYEGQLTPEMADAIVVNLKAADPEVVYLAVYDFDAVTMLEAMERAGVRSARFATSAIKPEILDMAGAAAERLAFPHPSFDLDSGDEAVARFAAAYKKKYGNEPSGFAAYGYDAVKVVAAALTRTKIASPGEVADQLREISYTGITGPIDFDSHGDIQSTPHFSIVSKGKLEHFDRVDSAMLPMVLP